MTTPANTTITVYVFAPRSPDPEPRPFTWDPHQTAVGRAALEAAHAFGYDLPAGAIVTFQVAGTGQVLDPRKSLTEVGVKDGAKLELTSWGGGV